MPTAPITPTTRLIASITTGPDDRRALARAMGDQLGTARAPVTVILPLRGIQQWDRPGEPLHDPDSLAAFADALRHAVRPPARLIELDAHINDPAFAETVLATLDDWAARGIIPQGTP